MIMSRDELGGEIFVIFIMTLVLHTLPQDRRAREPKHRYSEEMKYSLKADSQ